MRTVAEIPVTRKPVTTYYAHYFDQAGAVTKSAGALYFVTDDGEVTEIALDTLNFLTVLGQMQLADAQRIADLLDGGPAAIACSREEGRQ
jgi:hypothetical protein